MKSTTKSITTTKDATIKAAQKTTNTTVAAPKATNTTVAAPKATNTTVAAPKATNTTVAAPKATNTTVAAPKATNTTVAAPKATNTTVAAPKATNTTVAAPKATNTTVAALKATNTTVAALKATNTTEIVHKSTEVVQKANVVAQNADEAVQKANVTELKDTEAALNYTEPAQKAKMTVLKAIACLKATQTSSLYTVLKDENFVNNTMAFKFEKQAPCIAYISAINNEKCYTENDESMLHLFGEDISATSGCKQFYAMDRKTVYLLSKSKQAHLYEYYDDNVPLKLFVDIDIKNKDIPDKADRQQVFDDTVRVTIDLIKKNLIKSNPDCVDPQIIVLASSSDIKLSSHIIFPDVVFKNVKEMKFFMAKIDHQMIEDKIIDPNVYRRGGFRMLYNSKAGKKIPLEFHDSYNYFVDTDEELFMDCLITNVNIDFYEIVVTMPKDVIIKKVVPCKPNNKNNSKDSSNKNTLINKNNDNIVYHPISTLCPYIKLLSVKKAENYGDWIKIGMILHNCNPSEESFDLWDEWSKLSKNYESRDYNAYMWNSFKTGFHTIGSLMRFAKIDSPDAYPKVLYSVDQPIFKSKEFESNYLLNSVDEKINDNCSPISQEIMNWMNDKDIKSLAIKSPYNTGKTKLIEKIIREFRLDRVLFISYRQTLTQDIYGNFKDLGVKSYLDKVYQVDKLICQIESLKHLLIKDVNGKTRIPNYDLIILDEIESVLNHFVSNTIDKKEYTFDLMTAIISNSKKVLALDGDLHNRSYDFLQYFGKVNMLTNTIKKDKKNYIFTNNRPYFEECIDEDLKNHKNVIVVSMSSKIATYLNNLYEETYVCALHCGKASDFYKKELQDVNNFWSGKQLVLYSPSIEAGVNFSIKHFHKMYIILSSKSTSPRGLLQMNARVRELEDPNVLVFLNNIPFKQKANYFKFDEVKNYVCDTIGNYKHPKIEFDTELNEMVATYEFDLYTKILVHNETERSNKTNNVFVALLIKLLTDKGHTYVHSETQINDNEFKKDTLLKNEVLNGFEIKNRQIYNDFASRCYSNEATREDKVAIEKFKIKEDWKIKDVTDEFLTKFYGKTDVLYNLRFLLDESLVEPYYSNKKFDPRYNLFEKATKIEQIKMIKEVINILGFALPLDNVQLNVVTFENNIKKVTSMCQLFINVNKSQPLFGFEKNRTMNVGKSITVFRGFLNDVLELWGLNVISITKDSSAYINGKKKTTHPNVYMLIYVNDINKYI